MVTWLVGNGHVSVGSYGDISLTFDHVFTEGPGHAIEIAKQAADSGYHYLIAIGGDGTVNEVVKNKLPKPKTEWLLIEEA